MCFHHASVAILNRVVFVDKINSALSIARLLPTSDFFSRYRKSLYCVHAWFTIVLLTGSDGWHVLCERPILLLPLRP